MRNNIFGADIAGKIAKELGPLLLDLNLLVRNEADRTSGSLTGGRSVTYRKYPCKGAFNLQPMSLGEGSSMVETMYKVDILGDTLPSNIRPSVEDQVQLPDKTIVTIKTVASDPDEATFELMCRD